MADDMERFTMNAETDGERAWVVADPHPDGEWVRVADLEAAMLTAAATERNRIAEALEHEAEGIPCVEDAMVTRSNAKLIRADFSRDVAEATEAALNPQAAQ